MAEIKKISTELQLLDKFLDTSGSAGSSGSVLTSTTTGTSWVSAGTPGSGVYLPLAGGRMTGTARIEFNNASQYIHALSNNDLDIVAGDDINYRSNFSRFFSGTTEHCRVSGLANQNNWIANGSGGKLGVNITAPIDTLHVDGGVVIQNGNNLQWGALYGNGGPTIYGQTSYLAFTPTGVTGASSRMMLLNATGLGIGTSNPSQKLHVHSASSDGMIRVSGDNILNSGGEIKGFNNGFAFNVAPSGGGTYVERMRINGLGNVGIGDPSPTSISANTFSLSVNSSRNDLSGALISKANGTVKHQQYWDSSGYSFNLSAGNFQFNGGNVGVGTTSPIDKLNVNGGTGDTSTQQPKITVTRTSSTGNVLAGKMILTTKPSDPTNHGNLVFQVKTTASSGESSAYYTNAITIDGNNANVGIGTDSPGAKLEVRSDGSAAGGAEIRLQHANNNTNDVVSTVNFANNAGSVGMIQAGTAGANNTGYIALFTDIAGSSSERMRVHTNGNVGIGTTNPTGKLEVQRSQVTTQFDRDCFLRLHPSATTNSGGYTNMIFGTSTTNNYGVAIGGRKAGTGDTSSDNNPEFSVRILNDSITGTEVLNINTTGSIKFNNYNGTNNTGSPTHILGTDANGLIVKSTAGSSIGPWLPLVAGSGDPLTGSLFIRGDDKGLVVQNAASTTNVTVGAVSSSAVSTGLITLRHLGVTKIVLNANDNSYFTGNVGIGTTSPNSKLDVRQAGDGIALELHNTGGNVDDFVDIKMIAGNTTAGTLGTILRHQRDGSGGGDFSILTNPTLTGTPTKKLIVKSGGNVGIGTITPGYKLDVAGEIKGTTSIRVDAGSPFFGLYTSGTEKAYLQWSNSNSFLTLQSDGATRFIQGTSLAMQITSGGNVGIGLTNPGQKLEVSGNIKAHDGYIRSEDGATGDFMQMFNDGVNTGQSFITTSSTELVLIPQNGKLQLKGENSGSGNNASLEIYNALNAAVKVKLNSSGVSYFNGGNVGINQDNPLTRLDVIGGLSGSTAQQFNTRTATPPSGSTAIFRNGGNSSITILGDNQVVSNVFGSLNFGIWSDMTDGQIIYSFQDQFMAFSTANSEKLRIESGGEVGINITNPSATLHLKAIASNGVPFKLESHPNTSVSQMLIYSTKAYNSTDAWYNLVCEAGDGSGGQTNTCIIERDGDLRNKNNSYGQISDSRLKENIIDATPKLEDVMKVKVKNFNFIGEDLKQIGVVAQELEEVFPGLVKEDKQPDVNGEEGGIYKSVKYSVLVPILLKAMQEQQDQIEDLKTRITKLEN